MTSIDTARNVATRPPLWAYGWWVVVSALLCFGFLAQFTIGLPFFLLGVVLAGVGAGIRATRSWAVIAFPAGLALPLLSIAWLNKEGPGTICTRTLSSTSCEEQWNPWPWAVAACLLIAGTVLLSILTRRLTPTRRG